MYASRSTRLRVLSTQTFLPSLAALALVACGNGLSDTRFATGSQTLASSADYSSMYAVSEHDGVVTRLNIESGSVFELDLGGEATRIARNDEQVFVSVKDQRSIAVLKDIDDKLILETSISVGAEPSGLVLNEAGDRLYVAEAMDNRIREIDSKSLATLRTWQVLNLPTWLALHPSGDALYVASSLKGALTYIDLRESNDTRLVDLPAIQSNLGFIEPAFDSANTFDNEPQALSRRFTGDPTVSPDGEYLLIPSLYVDNNAPVIEQEEEDGRPPVDVPGGDGGYASGGRFNPSITIVPVGSNGEPAPSEDVEVVLLNGAVDGVSIAAYPSSVSVDPDSEVALAAIEGSSTLIGFSMNDNQPPRSALDLLFGGSDSSDLFFSPGFSSRNTFLIKTDAGPNGISYTDEDTGYVFNFLDRTIARFDNKEGQKLIEDNDSDFDSVPLIFIPDDGGFSTPNISVTDSSLVISKTLPTEIEEGRRLFFSANDSRMSSDSAGLSCATCHFRGANDGLTWNFVRMEDNGVLSEAKRQTPSLAGQVSLTAPVRWDGSRASVAEDAKMTSQGLMGGSGLTERQTLQVETFVDWTRDIDNPYKTLDQERLEKGSLIFYREEVGCGGCHSGARATDNQAHEMPSGVRMQTRSLIGAIASPPYMHDGSVESLRDVLKQAKSLGMGDTSSLNEQEFEDLLLYVKSL